MLHFFLISLTFLLITACSSKEEKKNDKFEEKSKTKFARVIGWKNGKTPSAPEGFTVKKFADGFRNPRRALVLPNSDVLIVEAETEPSIGKAIGWAVVGKSDSQNVGASANRITLLRDKDGDGEFETRETFLEDLKQPYGMVLIKDHFYVANTDALWRYPYKKGDKKITAKGEKLIDLPAGGYNNHWTRNLIASPDQKKIYIAVGSSSNVGENGMDEEQRRANILVVNLDGSGEEVFASGLRNPVGMDFHPETKQLWTVVNERDHLGDELVPDYLAQVNKGEFYGWPYVFEKTLDPRRKGERDDLLGSTVEPELKLGSHTASLGLEFKRKKNFGSRYQGGAFIGQHGSWNSSSFVGYKVIFVPFKNGRPSGEPQDFLSGFIASEGDGTVHGRPVGVAELNDGRLLVCDDAANTVWVIEKRKAK